MNYFDSNNTEEMMSLNNPEVKRQIEKENYEEFVRKEKSDSKDEIYVDYEHFENIFTNEIYYRSIKDLPTEEKYILYLYCYERRTFNEICKILKKSKNEIIKLRSKAIKDLNDNVKKYRKLYCKKNGGDLDE